MKNWIKFSPKANNHRKSSPKQSSPSQFWNQSGTKKSNPKQSSPSPYWNPKPISKCKFRSGMPVNLFGDRDRDGVPNVFDCKPRNPKKQGWKPQEYKDSVVIQVPIKRLYYQRGRYGMGNQKYILRSVYTRSSELQKEANAKGQWRSYDDTQKQAYIELAQQEAKKLIKQGYKVTKVYTKKDKYDHSGIIKYTRPSKVYNKEIKSVMSPAQYHVSGEYKASNPKEYVKNMAKAIKSDKSEMEMPIYYPADLEKSSYRLGEGRHRILAAKKAGLKTIPVEVVNEGRYATEKIKALKIQEARDQGQREEQPEVLAKLDTDGSMIDDKIETPEASEDNIEFEDDSSVEFEE